MGRDEAALSSTIGGVVFPSPGADACSACHSWTAVAGSLCPTCADALTVLPLLAPVLPITLFAKPSPMRDALTQYKGDDGQPQARALSTMLNGFLECHREHAVSYFGSDWDCVVPVPSTKGREGAPLSGVAAGGGLNVSAGLRSSGLAGEHRRYDLPLFVTERKDVGGRVLLLEDAYVSGARSQTAAATLRVAGLQVVGILALGRRVNPDFNDCARLFWGRRVCGLRSLAEAFDWLTTAGGPG